MKITKSKLKKIIKEELANERLAGGEKLTTGEFSTTMRKQAAQTQQGLSDEERAMLIGVTDKLKQAATINKLKKSENVMMTWIRQSSLQV